MSKLTILHDVPIPRWCAASPWTKKYHYPTNSSKCCLCRRDIGRGTLRYRDLQICASCTRRSRESCSSTTKLIAHITNRHRLAAIAYDSEREFAFQARVIPHKRISAISSIELMLAMVDFQFACAYCGKPLARNTEDRGVIRSYCDFHWDHIYPKCLGGHDIYSNLAPACAACNLQKSGGDPLDYIKFKQHQVSKTNAVAMENWDRIAKLQKLSRISLSMISEQYNLITEDLRLKTGWIEDGISCIFGKRECLTNSRCYCEKSVAVTFPDAKRSRQKVLRCGSSVVVFQRWVDDTHVVYCDGLAAGGWGRGFASPQTATRCVGIPEIHVRGCLCWLINS